MDQLVQYVAGKTGLSPEQARSAASAVITFLKDKLPAPVAGQLDNVTGSNGDKSGGSGIGNIGDLGSKMGGMFGKL
jgi:hypothetical protein